MVLFSQNDTMLKYFRTTMLQGKQTISMQESVLKLKDVTVKVDNHNYYLKKGVFGVADSVAIEVNNEQKIIALSFFYDYAPDYSNDTAYIHELRKYYKIMNSKGKEFHYTVKDKSINVTKWENKNTIFELVELTINGRVRVYSTVFDSELYYKKIKGCIDVKKNENSIELLKRLGLF